MGEGIATWPHQSPEVATYAVAHLAALTELDAALAPEGGYSIMNHLGTRAFVNPPRCITMTSDLLLVSLSLLQGVHTTYAVHMDRYRWP